MSEVDFVLGSDINSAIFLLIQYNINLMKKQNAQKLNYFIVFALISMFSI